MFGESLIVDNANDSKKTDVLLKEVCPEVRNEILHHDYRAEQLQNIRKEFLGKVKPGDVVFCESQFHNVIFLDYPSTFYGYVKYKTIDGEIFEAPGSCFRILSNGTKWAEYKTKDKEKADNYYYLSRKNGYRVERSKLNNEYILKIFGDTQEEVDEFVITLENNLFLDGQ